MTTKPALSPTAPAQRIAILDTLRGFAIFGILMVNMQWMNAPVAFSFSPDVLWDTPPDRAASFIIHALFESKFFVLFSMLFGYGFWLFLQKPVSEGTGVVKIYAWRLILLIFFGAAHVLFLWPGDILVFYGLLGLVMLLFRKKKDKSLIKWAVGFILIPSTLTGLSVLMMYLASFSAEGQAAVNLAMEQRDAVSQALINEAMQVYPTGAFWDLIVMRLKEYRLLLPAIFFFYPYVLAMFLLGQYAARKGYLMDVASNAGFFKALMRWGLFLGIPMNLAYGMLSMNAAMNSMDASTVVSTLLIGFGGPLLTLGYVSAIVLLFNGGYLKKALSSLSAVGRMALTNYLMQSIVSAFLFQSYGLGLYGQVTVWQGMLITILIFALQVPFSIWWLSNFRFGPFEWLWRSVTYLKIQSMKRA